MTITRKYNFSCSPTSCILPFNLESWEGEGKLNDKADMRRKRTKKLTEYMFSFSLININSHCVGAYGMLLSIAIKMHCIRKLLWKIFSPTTQTYKNSLIQLFRFREGKLFEEKKAVVKFKFFSFRQVPTCWRAFTYYRCCSWIFLFHDAR